MTAERPFARLLFCSAQELLPNPSLLQNARWNLCRPFIQRYAAGANESRQEHVGADDIENLRECSRRKILLCLGVGGIGDLYDFQRLLSKAKGSPLCRAEAGRFEIALVEFGNFLIRDSQLPSPASGSWTRYLGLL